MRPLLVGVTTLLCLGFLVNFVCVRDVCIGVYGLQYFLCCVMLLRCLGVCNMCVVRVLRGWMRVCLRVCDVCEGVCVDVCMRICVCQF